MLFGRLRAVTFQSQLKAYAAEVERRMDSRLPAADLLPSELHQAMRYSVMAPGKRMRPALVLASAVAVGGSLSDCLDAACAVELVHCFSLIHDDLPALDNDDLRRGLPTCHVQFGEAVAILAGDALFALSFELMTLCPVSSERVLVAVVSLTRAASSLVNGETIDILSEGKEIDASTLSLIHERKTGALIAASCEVGALVGGGSASEVEHLRLYGKEIGLAFQIADDVLNETSTADQLGKAAGSDRARGKATYPALYGLEASRSAAIEAAERGIEHLRGFSDSAFLEEIARYSVERVH
ncbi:polyprenyl synthetase family protein [soil metagenome]